MKVFINENKCGFDNIIIEKPFFKGSEFSDRIEIYSKPIDGNAPTYTPVLEFVRADGVKIGRIMTSSVCDNDSTEWYYVEIDDVGYYRKTFLLNTITGVLAVKGKLEINILLYELNESGLLKIYTPGVVVNDVNGVRTLSSSDGYNIYVDDSIDAQAYQNLLLDKSTILASLALLESKKLAFEDNSREKISLNSNTRTKIGSKIRAKFGIGDGSTLDNSLKYLYADFEVDGDGYKLNLKNELGSFLTIRNDGSIQISKTNNGALFKLKSDGTAEIYSQGLNIWNNSGAFINLSKNKSEIDIDADSIGIDGVDVEFEGAEEATMRSSSEALFKTYGYEKNIEASNGSTYAAVRCLIKGAKVLVDSLNVIVTGKLTCNEFTTPNANITGGTICDTDIVDCEFKQESIFSGTMTIANVVNTNVTGNPTADSNIATKKYVDDENNLLYSELNPKIVKLISQLAGNDGNVWDEIERIIGGAPEALDTLLEIANALNADDDAIEAINQVITTHTNQANAKFEALEANKVDKVSGKSLIDDTEIARLASLKNYDDTELQASMENLQTENLEVKELVQADEDTFAELVEYMKVWC